MFTDNKSGIQWGIPIKSKEETAEGLQVLVQQVAYPDGLCISKLHCNGRAEFKGRFKRCANHLESSSRPTPRTFLKGTPSLSVDLTP